MRTRGLLTALLLATTTLAVVPAAAASAAPTAVSSYRLVNRSSGKVLAVPSGVDEAPVIQQSWTGADPQKWWLAPVGNAYALVNVASGKALDVPHLSKEPGTGLIQYTSTGGANQLWRVDTVSGGYRVLVSVNSGLVADVDHASTAENARVIQWPGHGGANQQWQLIAA